MTRKFTKAKLRRLELGLIQIDCAMAAGISNSTLSKFESGYLNLPEKIIKILAESYDCRPEDLADSAGGAK